MKDKIKILLRTCVLGVIILLMIGALNSFFQPVRFVINNYYTMTGFYEEPEDRIETLFLGSSVGVYAFSPMELYRDYGLCSYTIATQEQSLLASYYWLQETYRLHSGSLKNVVLDVSELRKDATDSNVHVALDGMKLSPIKIRAAGDYADRDFSKTLSFLLPLTTYHSRWKELDMTDFEKYSLEKVNGTRGSELTFMTYISTVDSVEELSVRTTVLDKNTEPAVFPGLALNYFYRILSFCRENGITLTLVKTPSDNWGSSHSIAVRKIAEQEGLTYLDFNFAPLVNEIEYIHPYDSRDGKHLNYYGTKKFISYLGKYLVENCDVTDVRGNESYAYMDEQYARYEAVYLKQYEISQTANVREAIEASLDEGNTVFLTIKEDGSAKISNKQRYYFKKIGLEKLSAIALGDSYIGIVTPDGAVYEAIGKNGELLTYEAVLEDGTKVLLTSGKKEGEYTASCVIDGEEKAKNASGINVTVYNNTYSEYVYSIAFATNVTGGRYFYRFDFSKILGDPEVMAEYENNPYMQNILAYNAILDSENAKITGIQTTADAE